MVYSVPAAPMEPLTISLMVSDYVTLPPNRERPKIEIQTPKHSLKMGAAAALGLWAEEISKSQQNQELLIPPSALPTSCQ